MEMSKDNHFAVLTTLTTLTTLTHPTYPPEKYDVQHTNTDKLKKSSIICMKKYVIGCFKFNDTQRGCVGF